MNIKKALQTILEKSKQGADVTEDIEALIEAMDIEEQIGKLSAKLEKAVIRLEATSTGRGRRRKVTPELTEQAIDDATVQGSITSP